MWTPEERKIIRDLTDQVQSLSAWKENVLSNNLLCSCQCKVQPHYRTFASNYFDLEGTPIDQTTLNLNDRFPTPACADEKGILFMNDAIIFCRYHPEDGWILVDYIPK